MAFFHSLECLPSFQVQRVLRWEPVNHEATSINQVCIKYFMCFLYDRVFSERWSLDQTKRKKHNKKPGPCMWGLIAEMGPRHVKQSENNFITTDKQVRRFQRDIWSLHCLWRIPVVNKGSGIDCFGREHVLVLWQLGGLFLPGGNIGWGLFVFSPNRKPLPCE